MKYFCETDCCDCEDEQEHYGPADEAEGSVVVATVPPYSGVEEDDGDLGEDDYVVVEEFCGIEVLDYGDNYVSHTENAVPYDFDESTRTN